MLVREESLDARESLGIFCLLFSSLLLSVWWFYCFHFLHTDETTDVTKDQNEICPPFSFPLMLHLMSVWKFPGVVWIVLFWDTSPEQCLQLAEQGYCPSSGLCPRLSQQVKVGLRCCDILPQDHLSVGHKYLKTIRSFHTKKSKTFGDETQKKLKKTTVVHHRHKVSQQMFAFLIIILPCRASARDHIKNKRYFFKIHWKKFLILGSSFWVSPIQLVYNNANNYRYLFDRN